MLASNLRQAESAARRSLYSRVYNELFTIVKDHPQLTKKISEGDKQQTVAQQMALLNRFLGPDTRFLEIGAGSCHLSQAVSKIVAYTYAVDVSEVIANDLSIIDNFQFRISDGCSIPVPPETIDIAYSYQLIEHLHPDDSFDQLLNIFKALKIGGTYICITNNRLTGPHDISKYFDKVSTGLHLKEYCSAELHALFNKCGFNKIRFYLGIKNRYFIIPSFLFRHLEGFISRLPQNIREKIVPNTPVRKLLDLLIITGRKG
jgi:SAM-dependent methyltransferase